ncbi:MAG: preprotein translocase subunit SecA [Candidatus Fermentithermobacillus carboniphilus]|uniref:Protein translocase subunit SecA n=1 Tax=Candidatus Fermentithermobacillus carboniphilus TaxID=3085328 RepID=A0AAT9LE41_9FIRM|nr:MAG: preprotein translocase subunit SecA [Candidatus Fermentithermobacillus carboniphilus]
MVSILKGLLDSNERELRRLRPIVQAVSSFEPHLKKLSDSELAAKTQEFKERIARGEPVDRLLPEAFATVREVSSRVLDMRHFDVQIMGGIVLHQGRIAEMQTGEGKTLVATLPAYLNAVAGRTVHVVTVNDYLAKRDREWMGQIYRFLGLDVGLVIPGMDTASKKKAYSCPIIYGTNTEFGFDYLRDNMAWRKEDLVQSELDYAIIDEVDSILIDEARTPLIISGQGEGSTDIYYRFRDLASALKKDKHYTVDEKARVVALTEEGVRKAEEWLGIENLYSQETMDLSHYLIQALRAKELMRRDVDYVVKDGEVLIVDEFTGRILVGRRFSDGLHQAIEAKEGVKVREETDTLATITVQNFFRMYKKLAGMTGTAATEESEFMEIYGLDVVTIPTNAPLIRTSLPDSIWKTEKAKFRAVVEEISEMHQAGRPVLVGTRSVEKSEMLSEMLKKRGIPHEVLNAKYHEREAEIVAQAGRKGAVTIATNMAGRGTDILLGGNPAFMARRALRQEGFDPEVIAIASEKVLPAEMSRKIEQGEIDDFLQKVLAARERYRALYDEFKKITDREHDEVVRLGGLHVIGTERHEARRIDNQLRGRAGRQGDPGSSRFYLSLEDELMRLFGGDLIASVMEKVGFPEDEAIEHPLITKSVETAQKRIEAHNFAIRKNVLEYDNVLNKQREIIYGERRRILDCEDPSEIVRGMMDRVIDRTLNLYWPKGAKKQEVDLGGLKAYFADLIPGFLLDVDSDAVSTREDLMSRLKTGFEARYREKAAELGDDMKDLERIILLRVVDQKWIDHLRAMEGLREGIGLRAYGQRDPLLEYQREGFELFQSMVQNIEEDTVRYLFRVTVKKPERSESDAGGNISRSRPRGRVVSPEGPAQRSLARKTERKVGRNDPCPCGSGKKYKNCCGKLAD